MNLDNFHFMTSDLRAEAVWVYGTYLAIRSDRDHYVALYSMGDFFVEVWYNPVVNEIVYTLGFTSVELLEPYLKKIDISRAVIA